MSGVCKTCGKPTNSHPGKLSDATRMTSNAGGLVLVLELKREYQCHSCWLSEQVPV